ncbi:MAG: hypothetical protein FJ030_09450 [Chloroflexi bacterium]|nr:hypothetical protein [Chloroflexota bacterium]
MTQQVTITTEAPIDLKPLLEGAIHSKLKTLQYGLKRTRERLAEFEKRFNLTSAEFERRFKAREIPESLDNLDWWMEVEALHLLETKYQALSEARFVG